MSVISSQTSTSADTFAPHRWAPLRGQPGTYARLLWGTESFFHQYALVTDSNSDTVAQIAISSRSDEFSVKSQAWRCKVRNAWLGVRFQAPLVAGKVAVGVGVEGAPHHLGCFVYQSTSEKAALIDWAKDSVTFSAAEAGRQFDLAVEKYREHLSAQPIGTAHEFRTHLYVLSAAEQDSKHRHRHAIFLHGPHCVADAAAALKVLSLFASLMARNHYDPFCLAWSRGDVENLPVTAVEAIGLNPDARDPKTAITMATLICRRTLFLEPQRPFTGPTRRASKRKFRVCGPALVDELRHRLKSKSVDLSVSHAIDAARHVAVWYLCVKKHGTPREDFIVNFGAPVDTTRHFRGRWKGSVYYCAGTTCGSTCVSLDALSGIDITDNEEDVQREAFHLLLPQVSQQWRATDAKACLLTAQPMIEMMGVLKEHPTQLIPAKYSDAYTSLGLLDALLPAGFKSDGTPTSDDLEDGLSIDDFVLTPRIAFTRTCLHTWSRAGAVFLSITYTDEYDDAYIDKFLDIIFSILRRATQ